jgi:hypothetical protein
MPSQFYQNFTFPADSGYKYKNFIYVPIPKNGSTTFRQFFLKHGWDEINVFDADINENTVLFGHITDPMKKHSKSIVEFLVQNNIESLIDIEPYNKILVSAIVDEHTIPMKYYLGDLFEKIHWIPLDYRYNQFDGTFLTNRFFRKNNLNLHITNDDIEYIADDDKKILYNKAEELKNKWPTIYNNIFSFLIHDLKKYAEVVDQINHINLDSD